MGRTKCLLGKGNGRNSVIELLRLICLFFIVLTHAASFAVNGIYTPNFTVNKAIVSVIRLSGVLCDNIFVLISGYYLINSKFSPVRIAKFVLQIWGYSVVLYAVCCAVGKADFSLSDLPRYLLPISYGQYWFMTAYMVLCLFCPILNAALKAIGRKNHMRLIFLSLIIFSIIPIIQRYIYAFSVKKVSLPTDLYSAPFFFMIVYSIGAYIRLYGIKFSATKSVGMILFGVLTQIVTVAALYLLSSKKADAVWGIDLFLDAFSILQVVPAVGILSLVLNAKPRSSRLINFAAGGALGIYIIHETPCVRQWLWYELFEFDITEPTPTLFARMVLISLAIFAACLIIDLLRKWLIERPLFYLCGGKIEKLWKRVSERIKPKE